MAENAEKGRVRAVLFDLGDTLLNYGRLKPYQPFKEAARQTYEYLKSLGQPVSSFPWYVLRSVTMVRWRVLWSWVTRKDFDSLRLLKRAGKRAGYHLTEAQYRELVWLWYEPLSRRVHTEPHLKETLEELRRRGIKMGIVSNTFVNACALNRDIAQRKLTEFFEFIYYSYEFPKRKPYPSMYSAAVETLGVKPGEVVFVGDRLDTDVKGAVNAGMHAVLKDAAANEGRKTPSGVLRIKSISGLLEAIDHIEQEVMQAGACQLR
jgi:putative hydrolase of the HAD superfamily